MDNVAELMRLLGELERRVRYRRVDSFFQDESRLQYSKHMAFFQGGAKYPQRLFSAANRVGKTICGAYETTLHLTGLYPDWWKGRRFSHPVNAWAVGQTQDTVTKILQYELLGANGDFGSGMIPKEQLDFATLPAASKVGVGVSGFRVKHAAGGYSSLSFRSAEQGVLAMTGTSLHFCWADEPLPLPIYAELITRLAVEKGSFIMTSTPILGLDAMLMAFCEGEWKLGEVSEFKSIYSATWDDVPHLDEDTKRQLLSSYPAYQRACRSTGTPMLGVGAVFPFSEEQITCDDFAIPSSWKKVDGLDVGWRMTARVGIAVNPDTSEAYVYRTYAMGELRPNEHRRSWETIPDWVPICIDPAAHGRGQADGEQIFEQLEEMGLNLINADNAREASFLRATEMFTAGKLKVFKGAGRALVSELLNLARGENGKVKDASSKHLTDAFRYALMGLDHAVSGGSNSSAGSWVSGARRW